MFDGLGRARPAPDTDLIRRAVGAPALAVLAVSHVIDLPATLGEFGLSQAIGPVSYAGAQTWSFSGPGAPHGYSERTQRRIDREVATLLTRAEAGARELLTEHMRALHQLTNALVQRETITGHQVCALVRAASPPSASADRPNLR